MDFSYYGAPQQPYHHYVGVPPNPFPHSGIDPETAASVVSALWRVSGTNKMLHAIYPCGCRAPHPARKCLDACSCAGSNEHD
jgi:hypothetical protein